MNVCAQSVRGASTKEVTVMSHGIDCGGICKLMVLSGLLASQDKKITDQERERIIKSPDVQIDLYTYGTRIQFADRYAVQLTQKGKTITPEKSAVDYIANPPEKKFLASEFPCYRAVLRSFFSYDKINLNAMAEIVLIKGKKKVVLEINFADYK